MQTINIMSDKKDEIKKENQNKVEENAQDTDLEKDTENSNENNLKDNIENKLSELNDKYLRLLAENQNLRKNHEQEKEDILKYGSFNFAQQILALTDNLDRAFQIFKNDEKFKTDEFKKITSTVTYGGEVFSGVSKESATQTFKVVDGQIVIMRVNTGGFSGKANF